MMRSRGVVTFAVLAASMVSGGWLLQRGFERDDSLSSRARLFQTVMTHVGRHYVDSLADSALYRQAVDGMLEELDDPYSVFLSPDRLRRLNETTSGTYGGIGIQIDVRDGWITVIARMPGTPAEQAGLQPGDRIIAINGRPTEGLLPDEALRALRGRKGSRVTLTVDRPGEGGPRRFSMVRTNIRVRAVRTSFMVDNGTAYIGLGIFSDSTANELGRVIDSLRTRGMKTLVLDLRSNPGGLLEQGVEVSDLFLDRDQDIVSLRGRAYGATRRFTDGASQRWPDLRLVVLVNGLTASAAEIVAGALQDHDRAVIVGTTTYGKGSAQSVFPIAEGGGLKLTTGRWFTPKGRSIQLVKRGSSEDVEAEEERENQQEGAERPLQARKEFRTDAGRVIYGGGGITPDLIIVVVDSLRPRLNGGLSQTERVERLRSDRVAAAALDLGRSAASQKEMLLKAAQLRAAQQEDVSDKER
ncbi:MAG: S41 family peptidase [Gemmatimonadaceae bacterium]